MRIQSEGSIGSLLMLKVSLLKGSLLKGAVLLTAALTAATSLAAENMEVTAKVISATPIIETVTERIPHEYCRQERVKVVERKDNSTGSTVAGAVVGGVLGNVMGHHSRNRDVITGVGVVTGAIIGNEVAKGNQREDVYYTTEQVCEIEYELKDIERVSGYRVTYEVGDTIFETVRPTNPGETMQVRMTIQPLP